ncbi:uncharacterized protein LOC110855561 [Folsomia candida]|uniref:uncharacterized protein LOC110855561 n=1 Tax=Folsomia candida TaxID=158441 RepID=UPI001604CDF3|nr:uncharacterized protein LOC110855561 [Folsomia candida]
MQNFSDKNRHNMELRSTSSREERGFSNFNPKKARAHANDAMSKVFRNPLILDAIFTKVPLPDLKAFRLVSREWADVASTLLGKLAYLHTNKLFTYKWIKFRQVLPVNDKLTRRLLISGEFDRSIPSNNKKADVTAKVLTHVANVSHLTREIKFVAARKEFVPPFLEGIRVLGSTKAHGISILSAWEDDTMYTIPAEACRKLAPQPDLSSLTFKIFSDFKILSEISSYSRNLDRKHNRTTGCYEFQPLVQIWLEAAPNLTTLDVAASLYPNLEGCKSLKILKFKFVTCKVHFPYLDLDNVTKMLGQVQDSLVELELSQYMGDGCAVKETQTVYELPVMSKLTSLSIRTVNVYRIRGFFDEDHFPKLKTLSVHHGSGKSSLSSHLNLWRGHSGVESLALTMDFWTSGDEEDFEGKIIHLFPAVKEFDLTLKNISYTSIPTLNRSIESFKMWDLERVDVVVDWVKRCCVWVEVLKAVSVFKGDKSLLFSYIDVSEDQFSHHIQDLVLYSRGFKRVEISGRVEPEFMERIRPIFEASGAPIYLTEA